MVSRNYGRWIAEIGRRSPTWRPTERAEIERRCGRRLRRRQDKQASHHSIMSRFMTSSFLCCHVGDRIRCDVVLIEKFSIHTLMIFAGARRPFQC